MLSKGFKSDEVDGWLSYIRERIDFWQKKAKEAGVKSPYQ
jgi:hypothetical protein